MTYWVSINSLIFTCNAHSDHSKQVSVNIINVTSLNDLEIVTIERLDYNVLPELMHESVKAVMMRHTHTYISVFNIHVFV